MEPETFGFIAMKDVPRALVTGQQGMGPLSGTGGTKKKQPANEARHRFMTDLIERAKKRAKMRIKAENESITYVDLRDAK